jgi:hypothetical protein
MKTFDEYVKNGTIVKQRVDEARAKSLSEEAENRNRFLTAMLAKMKLNDDNANYFIEQVYDIIMELIRANMLMKGFRTTQSRSAHESEVAYLFEINISERDIRFMDELRYFRNGIKYYGKKLDKEYATKVLSLLESMKNRLC